MLSLASPMLAVSQRNLGPPRSFDQLIICIIDISILDIKSVNLNLLPVLEALLAERNVTRAARRIGLSQPAVSSALAQLRTLLGDPLLLRTRGGMQPTERALALRGPLRSALAALETALEPRSEFNPRTSERIFVIATTDFAEFVLLPRLLSRLEREAPGVRLRVLPWQEHRVPPTLETGEVDLMIGFYRHVPAGCQAQPLFEDRFVCVVRKGHPRVKTRLSLKTYVSLPHILVSIDENAPGVVDRVLSERGLRRNVGLRLTHFLMVPPVVAMTDYAAALSDRIAEPFARMLPLKLFPPPLPLPSAVVGQVWHDRTHESPPHAWLRRVVAEVGRSL